MILGILILISLLFDFLDSRLFQKIEKINKDHTPKEIKKLRFLNANAFKTNVDQS